MKYVGVKFGHGGREYLYKTKLNLIPGAQYHITNDRGNDYHGATVTVTRNINGVESAMDLREIMIAECVTAPSAQVDYKIKNIYENHDKGITTVLWTDGDVTTLTCDDFDYWDREKVIGLAYMKKHYGNRGCYNNEIRKWCRELHEREFNKCL